MRLDAPTTPAPAPAVPPSTPPAEDWVRAPLVSVRFKVVNPDQDQLLMAGSKSDMRSRRDVRALWSDFTAVAHMPSMDQARYEDAVRGASAISHDLGDAFAWLKSPAMAVLRGRDGWLWTVPLRVGDGSEPIPSSDSMVPSLDPHMGSMFTPTNWDRSLVAIVSGDQYIDTRLDINHRPGSLEYLPVPAAPDPRA